jgi:hypothetical protein
MAKTKSESRTVTAPPKPVVLKSPSLSPEVGDDALLDTPATANWLGVSNQWLELARCKATDRRSSRSLPGWSDIARATSSHI